MKTTLTIILCFLIHAIFAQKSITGKVSDSDGNPVFAANVFLQSNPQAGCTTDFDGKFTLSYDQFTGNDTLTTSFIGFKTSRLSLNQLIDKNVVLIQLEEDNQTLNEVSIIAKEPISEQFSVTKLEALDIYLNPVSNGDPLKAITSLPASTTTDESANPSLRGSSADRSRVVVNGVPVYRPVRNSQIDGVGLFSLFNTQIINKQYVYASNPPLTYGNTSAGLVEIETINKLNENSLSLSAGLAQTGFLVSQIINNQSFIQAYANYQFSDAFIGINKKSMHNLKRFGSTDAGINFYSKIGKRFDFSLFSYGIIEDYKVNFDLFTTNSDAIGENSRNFNILNLKYQLKKGFISISNGTNFSKTSYQYGNIYSGNNRWQVYNSLNYKQIVNDKLNFQAGASIDYSHDQFNDSIPVYYYALSSESENYYATNRIENQLIEAYAYLNYRVLEKILLMGGIRKNIPIDGNPSFLSSQLGIKLDINYKQNILLSGGIYHNYSVPNYYQESYELLKSQQLAIDYDLAFNRFNISAALFYKDEAGKRISSDYQTFDHNLILGAELYFDCFFSKSLKLNFANTFINQKIKVENREYPGDKDLNYFIKTTLSYNNPRMFTAALTYVGRPGLFYTPVESSVYNADNGFYQPYFSQELNSSQYNAYNNLSINLSKYIQFYKHVFILYASCNNVLNRYNQSNPVYNQDYNSYSYSHYQLRTIYFGVVWEFRY